MQKVKIREVCDTTTTGHGDYVAPDIFPDFARHSTYMDRRDYIEGVLVDLIERDELNLTDVFAQQYRMAVDIAGDVILGLTVIPVEDRQERIDVPYQIDGYTVKLRSMDEKPITWKTGMQPRGSFIGKVAQKNRHRRVKEVHCTVDATEIDLPLKYAWKILKQKGKYCKAVKRDALAKKLWKVEEILRKRKGSVMPEKITTRRHRKEEQ